MIKLKNEYLFSDELLTEIREKFAFVNVDPVTGNERLFFDNAGGSLRLKSAVNKFMYYDFIPDHPQREHHTAKFTDKALQKGIADAKLIFNANGNEGIIVAHYTASEAMFAATRVIAENIPGTNVVTTSLEHPSAYDSAKTYAAKFNKEFRVAKTNPVTGGVDVEEIIKLIDKDTCFLTVIYASNISGSILDIETIVKEARKIKPDLYIIVDAVQHAPHGLIDVEKIPVDAINFAPYKFFGVRGCGILYLSERASKLPHDRLLAKAEGELQIGSPVPAHYAAISEIVDYVCWIGSKFTQETDRRSVFEEGMKRIFLHENALLEIMLNGTAEATGLRNIEGVTVHLDYEDLLTRDFIVAMSIDSIAHEELVQKYEAENVIVYERVASSILSKRMLDSFQLSGAVRVSPLHCHTVKEMEEFLRITKKIAENAKNE